MSLMRNQDTRGPEGPTGVNDGTTTTTVGRRPSGAGPVWLVVTKWLLIGLTLVLTLIGVLQNYLTMRVGQGLMFDLRNQLYQHLQRQSLGFYTVTRAGEGGSASSSPPSWRCASWSSMAPGDPCR